MIPEIIDHQRQKPDQLKPFQDLKPSASNLLITTGNLASVHLSPIGPLGGLVNLPSCTALLMRSSKVGIQAPNCKILLLFWSLTCFTCFSILWISLVTSSLRELFNHMRKNKQMHITRSNWMQTINALHMYKKQLLY